MGDDPGEREGGIPFGAGGSYCKNSGWKIHNWKKMKENSAIRFIEDENCKKALFNELRGELILAVSHLKGENKNIDLVERYVKTVIEKLTKLEELLQ